jgi:hypothetical protein
MAELKADLMWSTSEGAVKYLRPFFSKAGDEYLWVALGIAV